MSVTVEVDQILSSIGPHAEELKQAVDTLAKLDADEVLSAGRAQLADKNIQAALAAATAHADMALLADVLEKTGARLSWPTFEMLADILGQHVVPVLRDAKPKTKSSAKDLRRAILFALGTSAARGEELDPAYDELVDLGNKYAWGANSRQFEQILGALPPERRDAMLLDQIDKYELPARPLEFLHLGGDEAVDAGVRRFAEREIFKGHLRAFIPERLGKRGVEALCRHADRAGDSLPILLKKAGRFLGPAQIEQVEASLSQAPESQHDMLFRLAAEIGGSTKRVYLLFVGREKDGFEPDASRLSRTSGSGPLGPQDDGREHLFTLDLAQVPELAERYPDANALTFYGRQDNADFATMRPIPVTDEPPESFWTNGRPIAVVGVDLPTNVFSKSAKSTERDHLRSLIYSADARVFGPPRWVQDPVAGAGKLIVEIDSEALALNLGDGGALFVCEHETVFQCH